ncbi:MAG TPA: cysteine desulfurase family protein [Pirellulales bacterium]|nr:cysteine desulfurase family protein [Pirellulales bacterium]
MTSNPSIYLDHNATTPLDLRVAEAMWACASQHVANPASQHSQGQAARRALEDARHQIALHLGARIEGNNADQLIFTSGATEANNLALRGLAGQPPGRIIISSIEHPSVAGTAEYLQKIGFDLVRLPVDAHGVVQPDALDDLLTPDTRLVSVMLGNNETGVLQPVQELARHCSSTGVRLHTDAVQVAAKLPVDVHQLGVAALTLTAHKFHGPPGIGALVLSHGTKIAPLMFGGFQQGGLRPGTESVVLATGMLVAMDLWEAERQSRIARIGQLRDRLEQLLLDQIPEAVVHGSQVVRLPHTSCLSFPGLDRQALLMALDIEGVACSTGSACASGSSEPSPVLLAMGCDEALVESALRFSLGASTTAEMVDEAARRILLVLSSLRRRVEI